MKVTVDSKKGLSTNLKIVVDKKTINSQILERFEELKNTISLKGFRPGKVPLELIKKQLGKAVYSEILDKILRETSIKALEEKKIKAAGQPKINLKSHGENKDLEYTIQVEQLPEIKIKEIDNIKISDYEITISEKDIEQRVKEIAKNQNNFKDKEDKEGAAQGDLIIFDYKASIDGKEFEGGEGKNTQIVLGKDLFIKNFDKQLIGSKKNENITVEVILPDNYPKKEYSNKKAKFICKIINVKRPEKTVIDDNFAKSLGAKNLKDLKQALSKQIQQQYTNTLENIIKKEIFEQLEKFKNIEIPESLVRQELEVITQGIKNDEVEKNKKSNEELAKKRIKIGLILNEIGEKNNLKVNEEEIKKEIEKQIQMMPDQSKQVMDYYKNNAAALQSLRGGIYEDKIIAFIKQKAKSTKKTISIDEAEKIIIDQNKENEKNQIQTQNKSAKKQSKPKLQKISQKKPIKAKKVSKK